MTKRPSHAEACIAAIERYQKAHETFIGWASRIDGEDYFEDNPASEAAFHTAESALNAATAALLWCLGEGRRKPVYQGVCYLPNGRSGVDAVPVGTSTPGRSKPCRA